ncbi:MAG: hypothetical protein D6771_06050, partial [Zetaproteobacteria bacterium]
MGLFDACFGKRAQPCARRFGLRRKPKRPIKPPRARSLLSGARALRVLADQHRRLRMHDRQRCPKRARLLGQLPRAFGIPLRIRKPRHAQQRLGPHRLGRLLARCLQVSFARLVQPASEPQRVRPRKPCIGRIGRRQRKPRQGLGLPRTGQRHEGRSAHRKRPHAGKPRPLLGRRQRLFSLGHLSRPQKRHPPPEARLRDPSG